MEIMMKKHCKSILAAFLAALMLMSVISVGVAAQAAEISAVPSGDDDGTVGDCTYHIDEAAGTLTIDGSGSMGNRKEMDWYPWHYYDIKKVVIGDGVTNIGNYAFDNMITLEEVTIGSGVTKIGKWAFNYCPALKSVHIPSGVRTIKERAFRYCMGMESLTFDEGIEKIGMCAFENCKLLSAVTVPKSVKVIESSAFEDCSALAEVNVLCEDAEFGINIFKNTAWFDSLPDGVLYFGKLAYQVKGDAQDVVLRDGTAVIAPFCFSDSKVRSVIIPDGVEKIGEFAF